MDTIKELKTILKELKQGEVNLDEFIYIAKRSTMNINNDVELYLKEATDIFSKLNNISGEAYTLAILGWCYNYNGLYEKSIEYQRRAIELFTEADDKKGLVYTYNGLMAGYFQLGLNTLSVTCGMYGLKIAEEINYTEYIVTILLNMSINYSKIGKFYEAKESIEAIEAMPYVNNKAGVIVTINQVKAEVHCEIGDINESLECANKALELAKENNFLVLESEAYRIRGVINGKLSKLEDSEKDFEASLKIARSGNYREAEAWIFVSWAQINFLIGNNQEAIDKLLKALDRAEEYNYIVVKRNVYIELHKVYKKIKNYEKALYFYEKFIELEKEVEGKSDNLHKEQFENEAKKQTEILFKKLYDDIKLISKIGKKITSDLNINNLLENISKEIELLIEAHVVGIVQYDDKNGILDYNLFIEKGKKIENIAKCNLKDDESIGAYSIKNKCNLLIGDIYKEYGKYIKERELNYLFPKVHSMIYCPLILKDRVLGFLTVQSYNKQAYTDKDLYMVSVLASYVAIAIENSYLYNQTKFYATHDYLTGLLSRKEIFEQGENLFKLCSKEKTSLTFMMIDIDNFKRVNDTYGHAIGDEAIKAIGGIINSKVASPGISGRYGGEEFLIIIPNAGEEGSFSIGDKIRRAMEKSKISIGNNKKIKISGSIGMFISYGKEKGIDQCISFADEALYVAKAEGRNKIVQYENFG